MKPDIWATILALFIVTGCAPANRAAVPPAASAPGTSAPDLFPDKGELRHARAFTLEYHGTYKIVTVLTPWRGAGRTFRYVLVPRGTPPPAGIGDARVIEIPVRSIASLSTTHLPYLDELDVVDRLTAIGDADIVNNPKVLDRYRRGAIQDVGRRTGVNVEALLGLQPQIVTTLALGNPEWDNYATLTRKGFTVIPIADYMEETPLGRAEWIKFMAPFFDREAQAESVFRGIEQRYLAGKAQAQQVTWRPTVVMGFEIHGKWNMPGGKSFQATYVQDAGGDYLWSKDSSTGTLPLSFEIVLDQGTEADVWLNQSQSWLSLGDILAADPRYKNFRAVAAGRVYNNNARLKNGTSGNDYNESGHANPDQILADLIAILHPELLPGRTLQYYRPLK